MNEQNEDLAIAGLLHDIGKFGQRAEIKLRSSQFSKFKYNYLHAAYSAQIMTDNFDLDDTLIDYSAMHHNLKDTDNSDEYWIVAASDRLASGFEREVFENYNLNSDFESENFKTQRLKSIFDETKEYKIDSLNVNNIFSVDTKSNKNEYIQTWQYFLDDLAKIDKGNRHTDLATMEYLLKKHTTFIPSSTTFKKGEYDAVKSNIPLYDHLKTTALFAGAIESMDYNNKLNVLNYYKKEVNDIEQNDFLLIAGDFFGIQKFIFDSVEAKNASKILRAKSAYIQILTKIVAISLCKELGLSRLSIVSDSAGKFEILASNSENNKNIIKNFQIKLNQYFMKFFYAETGIGISFVECGLADFITTEQRNYKKLRTKLSQEVERSKFNKFDLLNESNYIFDMDEDLTNQNLCSLCHKRKILEKKNECKFCATFIDIGKELSKDNFLVITQDETNIEIFDGYYIKFVENPKVYKHSIAIYDLSNENEFRGYAKWELSSYVAKTLDENEQFIPKTFEELAHNSVADNQNGGVKVLMSLKGDVDGMGDFIKNSDITNSFAKFNFFSRMVDYYFSVYVPYMMKNKYQNTYTVFAGGDDIFVLGAWDEIINLSKEIRDDFKSFCENKLSFSAGMIMTKSNKPINFVAQTCEEELEKAKEHIDNNGNIKDAISLFGETVKWDDYLDDNGLMKQLNILSDNTAFLYRLLELTKMSKNISIDIKNSMWKSKLNYSFYRNIDMKEKENQDLLQTIDRMIEKYPEETKMFLSEFIYKRRES